MCVRLARYTLPSLLQGHPPSQSSGTLMSLQEGIAEPRACGYNESFLDEPSGRQPDAPTEPPRYPDTYLCLLVSYLRYLTRVFPFPVPAQSSHSEQPVVRILDAQPRPTSHHREGRELVGERQVCSVATSGCPTRSEDGFPAGARNIPPRPV